MIRSRARHKIQKKKKQDRARKNASPEKRKSGTPLKKYLNRREGEEKENGVKIVSW